MIHQDFDSLLLRKVKHQRALNKEMKKVRTPNPLVITVVKMEIPLMYVGVRMPITMKNLRTRVTIINAISKDTRHKIVGPKS